MTKYCEDCKYYQNDWYVKGVTLDEPSCIHRHSNKLSHVIRRIRITYCRTCRDMRDDKSPCGLSAKLFEPKD